MTGLADIGDVIEQDDGTVSAVTPSAENILARKVCAEYCEMPAMRLTVEQAMRYWTIDRLTCTRIFEILVAERFLERDPTGRFRMTRRS